MFYLFVKLIINNRQKENRSALKFYLIVTGITKNIYTEFIILYGAVVHTKIIYVRKIKWMCTRCYLNSNKKIFHIHIQPHSITERTFYFLPDGGVGKNFCFRLSVLKVEKYHVQDLFLFTNAISLLLKFFKFKKGVQIIL